jgi:cytochrome c biogenesis protein ResB
MPYSVIGMKNFFLSLKTTVWTLFGLVCLFFIGSYQMPTHQEIFSPMNDSILFHWAEDIAAKSLGQTWWFFAALAGLVLLTINTIVCSLQTIKVKLSRSDFLLRISPQITHIGFLFIMIGHLLGAGWGYKLSGSMPEDSFARLPENRGLYLQRIRVQTDTAGFVQDWAAEASLYENSSLVKRGTLGPNRPLFYKGTGIYLKSLSLETGPVALLLIAKDPGAIWALAGGILFTLGSIALLVLKWKKA